MGKRWTLEEMPSQQGKTAIVTGANSGLGFGSVKGLASKGAHVIMACRNMTKAERALDELRRDVPGASAQIIALDLADLATVRAFSAVVHDEFDHVDILLNNAGVMATPERQTEDGFEWQLGINHLGHFALTGLLLDMMREVEGSRVVNVSSLASRTGKIRFHDLMGQKRYEAFGAYAQSKLANLLFTFELQRRLAHVGAATTSIAAHPGGTNTNLGDGVDMPEPFKSIGSALFTIFTMSREKGALSQLYASTAPEAEAGGYYGPDGLGELSGYPSPARVPGAATELVDCRKLWEISMELTGVRYLADATREAA